MANKEQHTRVYTYPHIHALMERTISQFHALPSSTQLYSIMELYCIIMLPLVLLFGHIYIQLRVQLAQAYIHGTDINYLTVVYCSTCENVYLIDIYNYSTIVYGTYRGGLIAIYIGRIPFDLILCTGIVVGYSLVHSKPAARHFQCCSKFMQEELM